MDEATALLAAVKNGEYEYEQDDYDDMLASLEKNAAFLSSTNQDDIDRAVKLLKRDLTLFKSLITPMGIQDIADEWVIKIVDGMLVIDGLPEQASVDVYTVHGHLLTITREAKISKGIYLVRISYGGKDEIRKVLVE